MPTERKRYYVENGKCYCETSIYHPATDNVSTSWVREVEPSEMPGAPTPPPAAPPSEQQATTRRSRK